MQAQAIDIQAIPVVQKFIETTEDLGVLVVGNSSRAKNQACRLIFGLQDTDQYELKDEHIQARYWDAYKVKDRPLYLFRTVSYRWGERIEDSISRIRNFISEVSERVRIHFIMYIFDAENEIFTDSDLKVCKALDAEQDALASLFLITHIEKAKQQDVKSVENEIFQFVAEDVNLYRIGDTRKSQHPKLVADIYQILDERVRAVEIERQRRVKKLTHEKHVAEEADKIIEETEVRKRDLMFVEMDDEEKEVLKRKIEQKLQEELQRRKHQEEKIIHEQKITKQIEEHEKMLLAKRNAWLAATAPGDKSSRIALSAQIINGAAVWATVLHFAPIPFIQLPVQLIMIAMLAKLWSIPLHKVAASFFPTGAVLWKPVTAIFALRSLFYIFRSIPFVAKIFQAWGARKVGLLTITMGTMYAVAFGMIHSQYGRMTKKAPTNEITKAIKTLADDPRFTKLQFAGDPKYVLRRMLKD